MNNTDFRRKFFRKVFFLLKRELEKKRRKFREWSLLIGNEFFHLLDYVNVWIFFKEKGIIMNYQSILKGVKKKEWNVTAKTREKL